MKKDKYLTQIAEVEKNLKGLERQLDRLGWLRVGAFILGVIGIVAGFEDGNIGYYLLGGGLLISFIFLVRAYRRLKQQEQYEQAKKEVLEGYIKRFSSEWLTFQEEGTEYIKEEIPRIKDLDLLGKGSLFQYLCVSHTPYGKKALAKALIEGVKQEELNMRQETIKELVEDKAFALHLQTLSKLIDKRGEAVDTALVETFIKGAEKEGKAQPFIIRALGLILPFISMFWLVLLIFDKQNTVFTLAGSIATFLQFGLTMLQYGSHNELFGPILKFSENIVAYKGFLVALEQKEFKSSYLKIMQKKLCEQGGTAQALGQLNKLTEAIKARQNMIGYFVLGSFLMWDYHLADFIFAWNKQFGKLIRQWLEVMGEVEALLSLVVLCEVKEDYSFPSIEAADKPYIHFCELKHPLLDHDKVVGNDFDLENETCIITGSNMSGKTTFLRTIGINLALAYAGGPVLGQHFRAPRMEVMTSMRIEDDVNQGISSFYAELLRIKQMIHFANREQPMLVLIDEIFKGTNSADRILGAKETIKVLEKPWISVMVSTHDFELCELEKGRTMASEGRKAYNYHFTEYYKRDQICFDYRIQKGRCQTTNAQYLLKMVGIIK